MSRCKRSCSNSFIFTGGIANCVFWDILLLTKLSSLLRLVKVDIFSLLRFSTQEVKNLLKVFAISIELSTFRSFSVTTLLRKSICFSIQPQLQLLNLHRNRRYFVIKLHTWFCLTYFLKTNIKFYCIYQYFMSINSFFNIISISRYIRPITVTRDPD
jgi:hypothetical protein